MAKPVNPFGLLRNIPGYARFGANDAIASLLLENAPHLGKALSARSLGTRIGQLDRGVKAWWSRHPEYASSLAELLDVSLSDLGLHASAAGSHLFSFDTFPELPPLDLTRETAWELFAEERHADQLDPASSSHPELDHWLAPAAWQWRPPTEMDWLCIPDNLERELLARMLSATGNFEVLQVETLADAGSRLLRPKPLIVTLRTDGGRNDAILLARRPDSAGILVIAPHMLTLREQTSSAEFMGWEDLHHSTQEGSSFRLDIGGMYAPLRRWTWVPLPDWRNRLLTWIEQHMERHRLDTLFSARRIQIWLSQFDPRGEWFCSTTDMLQLCRMEHHHRTRLPAANDADAGKRLTSLLFANDPALEQQVTQFALARWQQHDLPWEGALPEPTWLSLQSADMVEQAAAAKPQNLAAGSWLRQQRRGYFDFQHRTLANLVVRDRLVQHMLDDPLETWACACFDPERRPLVDAALDAVALPGLAGTITRLEEQVQDSAAAIGASEALFMALARRIAAGAKLPRTCMVVAQSVLARLDCSQSAWSCPAPWSRPSGMPDDQLEWITACWAWSTIWQPEPAMPENWLFPGWHTPPAEPPLWLTSLWPDRQREQLPHVWRNFFAVAQLWAGDLKKPLANPPPLLRITMLEEAARDAWPAEAAWWEDVSGRNGSRWTEDILLEQLKKTGYDAAARLWPSLVAFEQTSSDPLIRLSRIRRWMLQQLPAVDALALLDAAGRRYLAKVPESLPPAFRAPLLDAVAGKTDVPLHQALPFFRRFGPSAATALAQFLDDDMMGEAAAQCLWEWQPDSTSRLLHGVIGAAAAGRLIAFCPPDQLGSAIDLLSVQPALLDTWTCRCWIREHLSHAGVHAGKLLHILATLPPDDA